MSNEQQPQTPAAKTPTASLDLSGAIAAQREQALAGKPEGIVAQPEPAKADQPAEQQAEQPAQAEPAKVEAGAAEAASASDTAQAKAPDFDADRSAMPGIGNDSAGEQPAPEPVKADSSLPQGNDEPALDEQGPVASAQSYSGLDPRADKQAFLINLQQKCVTNGGYLPVNDADIFAHIVSSYGLKEEDQLAVRNFKEDGDVFEAYASNPGHKWLSQFDGVYYANGTTVFHAANGQEFYDDGNRISIDLNGPAGSVKHFSMESASALTALFIQRELNDKSHADVGTLSMRVNGGNAEKLGALYGFTDEADMARIVKQNESMIIIAALENAREAGVAIQLKDKNGAEIKPDDILGRLDPAIRNQHEQQLEGLIEFYRDPSAAIQAKADLYAGRTQAPQIGPDAVPSVERDEPVQAAATEAGNEAVTPAATAPETPAGPAKTETAVAAAAPVEDATSAQAARDELTALSSVAMVQPAVAQPAEPKVAANVPGAALSNGAGRAFEAVQEKRIETPAKSGTLGGVTRDQSLIPPPGAESTGRKGLIAGIAKRNP